MEVKIHPLTYQQFLERGLLLPDTRDFQHLPHPADCQLNLSFYQNVIYIYYVDGKDFSREVQTITLQSDSEQENHWACIRLYSDTISEANEGFLLVLSINERQPHFGQLLQENRVALALILDDDSEKIIYLLIPCDLTGLTLTHPLQLWVWGLKSSATPVEREILTTVSSV